MNATSFVFFMFFCCRVCLFVGFFSVVEAESLIKFTFVTQVRVRCHFGSSLITFTQVPDLSWGINVYNHGSLAYPGPFFGKYV